jgi:RpiR family transcriptional regulator, carbohydrate utilization regulator
MAATGEERRPSLFRLDELLPTLRQAEARLGEYIRSHPHDVIQLSITDLADRSETSEATVVRLCRKLGFRGFQDFKIGLAQWLVGPFQTIHEEIEEQDTIDAVKAKVFGATVQALQDTLSVIDSRDLTRAVELLDSATRVIFIGAGNSGWVSMDAALKLLKVGVNAAAYVDEHSQLVAASLLSPGGVAVGVSHSGATRDTLEALQVAKRSGASIICITGAPKSPITRVADVKLFTAAKETGFKTEAMTSRIAQLAIVDTLFVNVALRRGQSAADMIQKVREATAVKRL